METLKQHFSDKQYEITLYYDQWLCPNSTQREQLKVGPILSDKLLKEYGEFIYNGAYTTGFTANGAPKIDVWAMATDDRRYKYPEMKESGKDIDAILKHNWTGLLHLHKLSKEDYLVLFENAIASKYGFEYGDDSARISWQDINRFQKEIKQNPYFYYYTEDMYEKILNELKEYATLKLSEYELDDIEICEEDLVHILNKYNNGETLESAILNQLQMISKTLETDLEEEREIE